MSDDILKVKNIRNITGLSFGEIKKALDEAGGDETKTLELLKSKSATMASKKSSREVKDGVIESYIHSTRKVGAMIELLCETDFVAKNSEFQTLAKDIAMQATAMKPADVEELLGQPFIKDPGISVQELINSVIAKLGENIKLGRINVFEL